MDVNVFRKEIFAWLRLNVVGKTVFNSSLGEYISINKSGVKHAVSFSNKNYVQKLKSMYHLADLVETATFSHTEEDSRNRKTIKEIIILRNSVTVEEQIFEVQIVVRHTNEGRFYYDHALISD